MEFAFIGTDEADETTGGHDCSQERCDRLNEAATKASRAGHAALFGAIGSDETIPSDEDKILASAAAIFCLFRGMIESATRPEHQLARRLILRLLEQDLGPALAKLYAVEAGGA